jgi:hypothetical protein
LGERCRGKRKGEKNKENRGRKERKGWGRDKRKGTAKQRTDMCAMLN